jgi:hypothetical protein
MKTLPRPRALTSRLLCGAVLRIAAAGSCLLAQLALAVEPPDVID